MFGTKMPVDYKNCKNWKELKGDITSFNLQLIS